MPVERCVLEGKPGFKWGRRGRCYTYTPGDERSRKAARRKARRQNRAVKARQGDG